MGVRFTGQYAFQVVNFISPSKTASQQEGGKTRLCPPYKRTQTEMETQVERNRTKSFSKFWSCIYI